MQLADAQIKKGAVKAAKRLLRVKICLFYKVYLFNVGRFQMKKITLLLGNGINERGWARVISKHGRTTLIQFGLFKHVEVWEQEQRTYCGPDVEINYWLRRLDQAMLGIPIFLRTLVMMLKTSRGTRTDLALTSFYSSGLAILLLRQLGLVHRVVYFLADYLPPRGPLLVRLHRRLVNWLAKLVSKWSDETWLLSPRIQITRDSGNNFLVPIPVNEINPSPGMREEVGYIGYPTFDHGIDIIFEICKRHNFKLNVIGNSPYLESIKNLAPPQTVFHGMINDDVQIGKILSKCFCGFAIYRDVSENSYSYYGFPSKFLSYFANNVPVITSNVAHFNASIEPSGIGRVTPPDLEAIEAAVLDIKNNYLKYSLAISRFREERNAEVEKFNNDRFTALWRE